MTTQNPGFITVKEAAEILDRSTDTTRNLAYSGNFEYRKEHRDNHVLVIIRHSDVLRFKDARDAAGARPKTKEAEFPVKREGMGLFDYFAGQALAGLCANPNFAYRAESEGGMSFAISCRAYDIARAMVKGRDDCETPE